ncbi:MAG: hypothetical protein ACYTXE_24395 [Nostoc sp.]|uniref:hypothetical protein n=1 Tax=Nostoc sp. TaxID=1180 RepID=UPI002FFC29AD
MVEKKDLNQINIDLKIDSSDQNQITPPIVSPANKADWEPKLQVLTCISSQTVKSRPLLLVTVSNFLSGGIRFSSWGCLFSSYGCAKSVALLESVLVNYSRLTVGVDAVNGKSDESIAAFIF